MFTFLKKYNYRIKIIVWIILIVFLLLNEGCAIFCTQKGEFIHDTISLHYTEKGKGEPVILIHGILVNSDLNWRLPGIKRQLSKNFHVIAFDLRGHGKSDKPHGVEMYGLNLVEDVCRVMDNLNIEKAHIVGYSLGGFIALKFATLHPERCYSVTVGGAGWEKATEEKLNRFRNIYTAIRNERDCAPLLELVGMKKQVFKGYRLLLQIGITVK
jgi:pimeloyl-ACP methyl ester carboxylesterase